MLSWDVFRIYTTGPVRVAIAGLLLWGLLDGTGAAGESWMIDDFEAGLRPEWQERIFSGRTDYRVVEEASGRVLEARSQGTASALIFKQKIDLQEYPVLCWRWKVDNIVSSGDARTRSGDDYAARIYVVFPHWFFPRTRSINYIWANRLSAGSVVPNPFTANAMMVAVQSGEERVGEWVDECRNVRDDYRRIFRGDPPQVGAIAIMTDTDNTGSSALAWYDDIRFEISEPSP